MMQQQYPGAYGAMMNEMESYIGRAEVDDIIGFGQEGDYLQCEAQYSGDGGVPLSSYATGNEGVYPGPGMNPGAGMPMPGMDGMNSMPGPMMSGPMMPSPAMSADPMADPMDNSMLKNDMRDMLADRAKARQQSSEMFQMKAKQFSEGF